MGCDGCSRARSVARVHWVVLEVSLSSGMVFSELYFAAPAFVERTTLGPRFRGDDGRLDARWSGLGTKSEAAYANCNHDACLVIGWYVPRDACKATLDIM